MEPNDPKKVQVYRTGFPTAVEVSATDEQDDIVTFSCWGKHTEFAAPGLNIRSPWTMLQFGGYTELNGTSTLWLLYHVSCIAADRCGETIRVDD
jgi:hypothetical protein